MPKLIIDAAAAAIVMSKAGGQPVYAGPGGHLLAPGVVSLDDIESGVADRWQPGDARSRLLVLAAEACKELVFLAGRFTDVAQRRRTIGTMTVPVCALMDVVTKLLAEFSDKESRSAREKWPRIDQETYLQLGRRLRRKHLTGPVRRVRNRLRAHLDQDSIGDSNLRLPVEGLLGAMGDSLLLLMAVAHHYKASFAWIRFLGATEDGDRSVVETFFEYPICTRWLTDRHGHVLDVGCFRLAEDPRGVFLDDIAQAVRTYNEMVEQAGAKVPQIWTVPTADLLAAGR